MPRKARNQSFHTATEGGEEQIPSIFDFYDQRNPAPATKTDPVRSQTPDTAALLARIDNLERDLRERDSARTLPMLQQQQQQSYRVDPATIQVSYEGLPDYVEKPAEYNQMLTERINAALNARDYATRTAFQQQQEQQAATDRVWQLFSDRHPEWAEHKKLVGTAAQEIIADAAARGIDTRNYMFGMSERFCDDVVASLKKEGYDRLLETDGEGGDDGEPATPQFRSRAMKPGGVSEAEDAGRTAGIMGGSDSGGRPNGAKPKGGDFLEDLKAVQSRMGIY